MLLLLIKYGIINLEYFESINFPATAESFGSASILRIDLPIRVPYKNLRVTPSFSGFIDFLAILSPYYYGLNNDATISATNSIIPIPINIRIPFIPGFGTLIFETNKNAITNITIKYNAVRSTGVIY